MKSKKLLFALLTISPAILFSQFKCDLLVRDKVLDKYEYFLVFDNQKTKSQKDLGVLEFKANDEELYVIYSNFKNVLLTKKSYKNNFGKYYVKVSSFRGFRKDEIFIFVKIKNKKSFISLNKNELDELFGYK
jgi:hypothetical protein